MTCLYIRSYILFNGYGLYIFDNFWYFDSFRPDLRYNLFHILFDMFNSIILSSSDFFRHKFDLFFLLVLDHLPCFWNAFDV